ncbi:carbamate kinase [Actinomycetaceae bacterium TAE3-ERU4]|nr:carbamate kinase [Actinomycetaceae bacterium TAE3-ERU4]
MTKPRIVIALGGNALGNTPAEQLEKVEHTAEVLVELVKQGNEIVVTHGNGPQVGMINKAFELANEADKKIPLIPLPECGAMSQGYIGYHLQQKIGKKAVEAGENWPVASIVTQVEVDETSAAFQNPTKPVGAFLSEEAAKEMMEADPTVKFVEDAGRGWRRVVPSPEPMRIVEIDAVNNLVNAGFIVVCSGGGGVPVVAEGKGLKGVPAVIDKDFAGELLAEKVEAQTLCLLTEVKHVAINYNTPEQEDLKDITVSEAKKLCDEGQFAPGSMLPKVQAAIRFVESGAGRVGIIGALSDAANAINGLSGTRIHADS